MQPNKKLLESMVKTHLESEFPRPAVSGTLEIC